MIVKRISNEIQKWSHNHGIKRIPDGLFCQFLQKCKMEKGDVPGIDQIIDDIQPPINHVNLQNLGSDTPSPPFSVAEKVVAVVSAPLWIPITVVSVPFILIGISISETIDFKQYKKNKIAFMRKLTEDVIKKYNIKVIYDGLSVQFVPEFMLHIEHFCKNNITEQIEADRELIENMAKQDSNSETLQQDYFKIEQGCKEIIGNLLYAKIKHFSDDPPRILNEGPILGRGQFAIVHLCDVDFRRTTLEDTVQCAVKRPILPIQSDRYLQLLEAESIMYDLFFLQKYLQLSLVFLQNSN